MPTKKGLKIRRLRGEDDTIIYIEIHLPNKNQTENLLKLVSNYNNTEIYNALGVNTFGEYLVKYFAKLILNVLAFLLTFLIVTIVLRTIIYMLGIISDLPVIGGLNRLAGGALGMAKGIIFIWVIFAIVTLMYDTSLGAICLQNIEESLRLWKTIYLLSCLQDAICL